MNYYNQYKEMIIDHGWLGIQQLEHYENYHCTPMGAVIIALQVQTAFTTAPYQNLVR